MSASDEIGQSRTLYELAYGKSNSERKTKANRQLRKIHALAASNIQQNGVSSRSTSDIIRSYDEIFNRINRESSEYGAARLFQLISQLFRRHP